MVSRAERTRRKRAQRAQCEGKPPAAPRLAGGDDDRVAFAPRKDGLTMLRDKGRLTSIQAQTGRTYGALVRTAAMPDGASLRSHLDFGPSGGAGGGLPSAELSGAEWVCECRARLTTAQAALSWHAGMIATLGLICGQGLHPREITQVQRETEQIETTLRVALDILATHWRAEHFRGVGDWG